MENKYVSLKNNVDLEFKSNESSNIYGIDTTFKKLRPRSPFKLSQMLSLKFNTTKIQQLIEFAGNISNKKYRKFIKYTPEQLKEYYMYNKITKGKYLFSIEDSKCIRTGSSCKKHRSNSKFRNNSQIIYSRQNNRTTTRPQT